MSKAEERRAITRTGMAGAIAFSVAAVIFATATAGQEECSFLHKSRVQTDERAGRKSAASEIELVVNASGIDPARRRFKELQNKDAEAFDPQKTYPTEALKDDLKVLWDVLEEGHGGFDRYTPASVLKKSFDEAMNGLAGPLTELDFYLRLLPLVADAKDGHTRAQVSPPAGAFLDDQPIAIPVGLCFLGRQGLYLP